MKLLVIGLGQAGGRIADQFEKLNKTARSRRGIEIVTGAFAVNTDTTDLSGLYHIKASYKHRILIGAEKTRGHGVAKLNEIGAEIARGDADKIIEATRQVKSFYETDAFLLIASTAGGTGSGAIPVIVNRLKQRYTDKPVYAILVLPFEHEINTEERTIYNTAVCLKSVYSLADAVFLVDNQRFVRKDSSLKSNITKINEMIVEPFYNLLCTGEEKRKDHIGAKVLDAGDIMQTLKGWTVVGYGKQDLSIFKPLFSGNRHFINKGKETYRGMQAMDETISELSAQCDPRDASRALYLVSAPNSEMNMSLVKELGEYLKGIAPNAVIRSGDYPIEKGFMDVIIMLSQLKEMETVIDYYRKSVDVAEEIKRKLEAASIGTSVTEEASKHLPTLQ
jgi:cell division GTPase FtsZ